MSRLSRVIFLGSAMAVLASVAACADQPAPPEWHEPAAAVAVPVAVSSPSPARAKLGDPPKPELAPTVAKIQRWVKIFSGPSRKDITPPKDPGRRSHVLELNAVQSDQIGTYVTDGAGRTLYRFDKDKDKANPPESTCNGECARVWRPMLIKSPGKIYPYGVNPKAISYIERADHTCQVAINGHPLYFFAGDARPGDLNGQGVNGTWFAIAPNGGRTRPFPNSIQPGR